MFKDSDLSIDKLIARDVDELLDKNHALLAELNTVVERQGYSEEIWRDLKLVPDFYKEPDGALLAPQTCRVIARTVLAKLHEQWHGSPIVNVTVSSYSEARYWTLTCDNNLETWYISEAHDNVQKIPYKLGIGAHITSHQPVPYQQALENR